MSARLAVGVQFYGKRPTLLFAPHLIYRTLRDITVCGIEVRKGIQTSVTQTAFKLATVRLLFLTDRTFAPESSFRHCEDQPIIEVIDRI